MLATIKVVDQAVKHFQIRGAGYGASNSANAHLVDGNWYGSVVALAPASGPGYEAERANVMISDEEVEKMISTSQSLGDEYEIEIAGERRWAINRETGETVDL